MTPDDIDELIEDGWKRRSGTDSSAPRKPSSRLSSQSGYRRRSSRGRPSRRKRWKTRIFWMLLVALLVCLGYGFYITSQRPTEKGLPFRPMPLQRR